MASPQYDGPGTIDPSGRGRLVLEKGPEALRQLEQFFARFTEVAALPSSIAEATDLALTEWVTNILSYGFASNAPGTITVGLTWDGAELCAEIADTAAPFNPLEHPPANTTVPLEEKPIGGLGIHLLRKLMDELQYRRSMEGNTLIMRKRFEGKSKISSRET